MFLSIIGTLFRICLHSFFPIDFASLISDFSYSFLFFALILYPFFLCGNCWVEEVVCGWFEAKLIDMHVLFCIDSHLECGEPGLPFDCWVRSAFPIEKYSNWWSPWLRHVQAYSKLVQVDLSIYSEPGDSVLFHKREHSKFHKVTQVDWPKLYSTSRYRLNISSTQISSNNSTNNKRS